MMRFLRLGGLFAPIPPATRSAPISAQIVVRFRSKPSLRHEIRYVTIPAAGTAGLTDIAGGLKCFDAPQL
jgi:hypothetical protein